MEQRVARCEAKACYPLLWSLSPHTAYLAPAWFRWYFAQAARTGRDWFVLPPSGHLYAYPSLMSDVDQAAFVAATEADCELLSTSAVVAWEFAGTWEAAIRDYFPRYAARGVVQALFATNVPYMLPVLAFGPHEYKLLGPNETVALFKPHEWRGPQQRSAQEMASMVNGWAAGTIAAIYRTFGRRSKIICAAGISRQAVASREPQRRPLRVQRNDRLMIWGIFGACQVTHSRTMSYPARRTCCFSP